MRNIILPILIGLVILDSTDSFSQAKSDSLYLKQIIDKTQSQLTTLNNTLNENLQKSQTEVDRLSNIIANSKAESNIRIEALSNKLIELEKIQKIKENNEKEQNIKKFDAGKAAISSMKSGVKILNFTYDMLDLDQTIELTTNIWSDSTFRNAWNKIEDWGTITGAIIAVGGFASSNETSDQVGGLTIGIGVVGFSKILGTLFGVNEKKLRKKMERIDLSVRAYDDLNMRNKQLKTFIENNKDFEDRIKSFEVEYLNAANGDISIHLAKLVDMLDEYKNILKQIPTYLDEISSVSVSYVNNQDRYKELPMKKIFDTILKKCKKLKEDYNKEVKPLLDVSPEIKRLLYGIS